MQYLSFCLISLSIMPSRFIHVVHVSWFLPFSRLLSPSTYTYTVSFCLLIHQWADRLLPPFGYCGSCFYEHGCTRVSLSPYIQFWVCTQKWSAGSYGNSLFDFLMTHHTVFHSSCNILHSPHPTVHEASNFCRFSPAFVIFCFLSVAILQCVKP